MFQSNRKGKKVCLGLVVCASLLLSKVKWRVIRSRLLRSTIEMARTSLQYVACVVLGLMSSKIFYSCPKKEIFVSLTRHPK